MNNQKLNKISLSNLIIAYLMSFLFALLIFLILPPKDLETEIAFNVSDSNKIQAERIIKYIERNDTLALNHDVPIHYDRLKGIVVDDEESFSEIPVNEYPITHIRPTSPRIHTANHESETSRNDVMERGLNDNGYDSLRGRRNKLPLDNGRGHKASELDSHNTISFKEAIALRKIKKENSIGLDGDSSNKHELDLSKLAPISKDGDLSEDLAVLDPNVMTFGDDDGGELYAYNYPSKGVGAGIGNGGLGASAGQAAGISAGIGEGIFNGEVVPTLGGIGEGAKTIFGEPVEAAGVGGLIGGAGAGGAAGLAQGYITEKLGVGVNPKQGAEGRGGQRRNHEHLPKNGSLHIMMHVDGSGSILNTRKKLEIMKNTLLKEALLPYYENDESLYNKRVTIVDSSGERTLKFFNKATEKDNVLAIVFQDEAQPDYHLPNFNKGPEGHYKHDLNKLKSNLAGRKGIYRGIMFQVGEKNFSRSFKEFVENAWQGQGYLKSDNLKKYYWQENKSSIENKKGVVFSDEYHTKPEGDPRYYMDLIFEASKKVGIDLAIYGAGLKDGSFTENK